MRISDSKVESDVHPKESNINELTNTQGCKHPQSPIKFLEFRHAALICVIGILTVHKRFIYCLCDIHTPQPACAVRVCTHTT